MKMSLIPVLLIVAALGGCHKTDLLKAPTTIVTPPANVTSTNFAVTIPANGDSINFTVTFNGPNGAPDPTQTITINGLDGGPKVFSSKAGGPGTVIAPGTPQQISQSSHAADLLLNIGAAIVAAPNAPPPPAAAYTLTTSVPLPLGSGPTPKVTIETVT